MPYKAHLFICTNDRGPDGKRASCARRGSVALRDEVKSACKKLGLPKGSFRVNASGCLDRCEQGIVAVMYPEGTWLENLTADDGAKLVEAVKKAAEKP